MSKPVQDAGGFQKPERVPQQYSVKRFLPRTLFGRSLLILVTPVLLIQIVTTYMFFDRHWSKVTSRLANGVAGEIAIMVNVVDEGAEAERLERMIGYADTHLDLQVDFQSGQTIDAQHDHGSLIVWESLVAKTLQHELRNQLEHPFVLDVDFEEKWVEVDVQLDGGVLHVDLPQRRLFSSSGYVFLLWVFGSSILLLGISVVFMRNQIRPIRKLAVAAKRLGKGRDVPSFKPEGAREVRDAAQAFMDMHRRIKRQVSQRTAMLAGVSHDLRTPLTRLKLQLAMLKGDDVDAMKVDIEDMERMIDGYLDFVRGEGAEQTRITDLNSMIEKILKTIEGQDVSVHSDLHADMNVMIRPMGFERCLSNIILNAAKYAQSIWVSAHINDDKKLVIVVEDDGPGIPEENFEDVFKPFYRMDESRNIDTGGVGLGLPIAMDVVHAHGGKIWLEKSQHGGLRVNIRMPV